MASFIFPNIFLTLMLMLGVSQSSYGNFVSIPSLGREAYVMFAWKMSPNSTFEMDLEQFVNLTNFYVELQSKCHNCYHIQENFPAMYYFGSLFCKDIVCSESKNLTNCENSTIELEDLLSSADKILNKSYLNRHTDWNNSTCRSFETEPKCTDYDGKCDGKLNASQILTKYIAENIKLSYSYQHPETMLTQQLVVLLTNYCPADSIAALADAGYDDNIRNVKIVVVVLDESLITNQTCDKGDPKVNWTDINIQFIVPGGTTTFDPIVKNAPIESLQWLMLETDVQAQYDPISMPVNIVLWMNLEYVNMTLKWVKESILPSQKCKLDHYTKAYRFQLCITDDDQVLNWFLPIPGPTDEISQIYFDEAFNKILNDKTAYWTNITSYEGDQLCMDAKQLMQKLYADDYDSRKGNKEVKKIEQYNIVITDQYPLPIDMDLIADSFTKHLEIVLLNNGTLTTPMTEIFKRSSTFLENGDASKRRLNHFYVVNVTNEKPYEQVTTCVSEMAPTPSVSKHVATTNNEDLRIVLGVVGGIIGLLLAGIVVSYFMIRRVRNKKKNTMKNQGTQLQALHNTNNISSHQISNSSIPIQATRNSTILQVSGAIPTYISDGSCQNNESIELIEMGQLPRTMTNPSGMTISSSIFDILTLPRNESIARRCCRDALRDEHTNILVFTRNSEKYYFNISDFEELETLTSNENHVVKKCFHRPSSIYLAIKFIHIYQCTFYDPVNETRFKNLKTEIDNFRKLEKSPNIVDFYGLCLYENEALICMELMDMSLRHLYIRIHVEMEEKFPEDLTGVITVKVVDALIFCKSNGIMHRDIKPPNILISFGGFIKLCDFGESKLLKNSQANSHVGTAAYWPPEHFTHPDNPYDVSADVWSLGITLMEIIQGQLPYIPEGVCADNLSDFKLQKYITSANFWNIIDQQIKQHYSQGLCNFLKGCTRKVEDRPKFDRLLKKEFYCKYCDVKRDEIANILCKYEN